MPPKKEKIKSIFAEPEAKIQEMVDKGESSTREAATSIKSIRTQFSNFGMSFARHKMSTDSALREHRTLIGKHSEGIEQTTKELEEAFDYLWPKLTELEKSLREGSDSSKEGRKATEKNAEAVAELGEKIVDMTDLILKKHKSALTRINQINKEPVKMDTAELDVFKKELKELKKLVKEVGKYEYGSQLNVLLAGTPVGFTGQLNFKSGFTITQTGQGIDVVATGSGGGLGYLAATGTVDNSNTTFTFASTPTLVVVNGTSYRNGHGVTITGTSAVLDNAPGNGGDVYGLG